MPIVDNSIKYNEQLVIGGKTIKTIQLDCCRLVSVRGMHTRHQKCLSQQIGAIYTLALLLHAVNIKSHLHALSLQLLHQQNLNEDT